MLLEPDPAIRRHLRRIQLSIFNEVFIANNYGLVKISCPGGFSVDGLVLWNATTS